MESGQPPTFGDRLRCCRLAAGLSQEALAERARLSVQAVSTLERGLKRVPYRETVRALACALGLSAEEAARLEAAVPRRRGPPTTAHQRPVPGVPPTPPIATPRPARPVANGAAGSSSLPTGTPTFLPTDIEGSTATWERYPAAMQASLVVQPSLPAEFPPLASPKTPRHNLPNALTSLIGREREQGEALALLTQARLVTLVGSGGVGKTRLALAVAAELVDQYPDGVWLVELAPLSEPALVPLAVAQVLGLREEPGRALLGSLADHLKEKQLLLVLDNCEHLVAASAALVGALLRSCPRLTILATSREALGIGGERPWRLPSLGLPDPRQPLTPERALACEAVQLFVQRAQVVRPEFAPTGEKAGLVAQVCRRLDGIPLALELAAARLSAIALDQLSARLDDRFRLLTGGSRTALPRQQTLRATLDWSYDLLGEPEGLLLRRLSVFAGGWTLDAAEAICADDGITPEEVLDLMAGLVGKSLVQAVEVEGGGMRYRLLETVRQYGRETLGAAGEEGGVRERHLRWCLALSERAEPWLRGAEQGAWLAILDAEDDNLRAALDWAQTHERGEAVVRLGGALWWFWWMRDHMDEGGRWLAAMLRVEREPPPALDAGLWARALHGAGWLSALQRAYAQATALLERSLDVSNQEQDTSARGILLLDLGNAVRMQGQYRRAIDLFERAAALARRFRNRRLESAALCDAGAAWHNAGDERHAGPLLKAGLALSLSCGDAYNTGWCLIWLGRVAKETGEHEAAASYLTEALATFRDLGHPDGVTFTLEGFAGLAARQGRPARAARLFGQAEALREANLSSVALCDKREHYRDVRAARDQLGETTFAMAWAEGRTMSLDQAMSYAQTPQREPTSE